MVVLGGYFVPLAQWLLPAAEAEAWARSVDPDQVTRIVPSVLGLGAAATGGAAVVLDQVDAGNLPEP